MNDFASPPRFGALTGSVSTEDATLTLQRLLPGPIERIWAYLVESDLRRRWLAGGDMEPRVGAPFSLTWRNDELTTPPGTRPDGFGAEHTLQSRITAIDPPRHLAFEWGNTGGVTIDLAPEGDQVRLTLVHRRLPDRAMLLNVAAGWHAHLDILVARANDTTHGPAPFWDQWAMLKAQYAERIPAH